MMRWNVIILKRLAIGLFMMGGLIGCSAYETQPKDNELYEFALENDTLEMRDGVRLAVTYYRPAAKVPGGNISSHHGNAAISKR